MTAEVESLRILGGPWPDTEIVRGIWPLKFFSARRQWFLRYSSGKQVLVGDWVPRNGIVTDIRMGGAVMVERSGSEKWVSPKKIGAHWHEYHAGRLVRVYDGQEHAASTSPSTSPSTEESF
jgi:hypothetical protein